MGRKKKEENTKEKVTPKRKVKEDVVECTKWINFLTGERENPFPKLNRNKRVLVLDRLEEEMKKYKVIPDYYVLDNEGNIWYNNLRKWLKASEYRIILVGDDLYDGIIDKKKLRELIIEYYMDGKEGEVYINGILR